MDPNLRALPPHKRFSLSQKHHNPTPAPAQNSQAFSCLPAKKRKQKPEDSPPFPPNSNAPASICLPAKKRIRAFQPFDLNVEYLPSDEKPLESDKTNTGSHQVIDTEEIRGNECKPDSDSDSDDGIVCAVCGSTDADPTDPIVLCDGCDLMVHATCYGNPLIKNIPEGDWFCTQCAASKSTADTTPISCCLCPNPGGALKPTSTGEWAHIACAIYVPEVYFEDWEGREGIHCSKVLERRWRGKCYICRRRNDGCVVDCSEGKCGLGFHVSCGVREELWFEYREGRSKGGVVAAFCKSHSELWKKQQQTGKFKIVPRDEDKE